MTFVRHGVPPLLLGIAILGSGAVHGETGLADYAAYSFIGADVGRDTQGALAINLTAGDFNLQANSAAIAVSPRGLSLAAVHGGQRILNPTAKTPTLAEAVIDGQAYANATGWIALNQASGTGNAQANAMVIALGISGESLADSSLAAALPDATLPPEAESGDTGNRTVTLDGATFQGARGLVQVNQAAGSWNNTANNFALRVSVDAKP